MNLQDPDRVIQEWCAATGTDAWSADEGHYGFIGDTAVCINIDSLEHPPVMRVLCDLGPIDVPDLDRRLLTLNFFEDSLVQGCFGIEPQSGHVMYRLDIALQPDIHGADIPEHIDVSIEMARSRVLGQ
jgi:hypothetical protein